MTNLDHKFPTLLILLAATLFLTACAASTAQQIEEGNKAFSEEAYLVALQAYKEAQTSSPEIAESYYNAANSLYREQAYGDATAEYEKSLELSENPQVSEYGYFNFGNTAFQVSDWEAAIENYEQALLLNPEDLDAKYNLELALNHQQNEQQSQNHDNEEQSQEDQDNQSAEENSEEPSDGEGENKETGDSPEEQESTDADSSEGVEDNNQQDDRTSEEKNPQDEGDSQEDRDSQNQEDQEETEGKDESSSSSPSDSSEGSTSQGGSYVIKPGERMSEEQAKQLLATIAENSETLMEKLNQIFVVPFGSPEQDW